MFNQAECLHMTEVSTIVPLPPFEFEFRECGGCGKMNGMFVRRAAIVTPTPPPSLESCEDTKLCVACQAAIKANGHAVCGCTIVGSTVQA